MIRTHPDPVLYRRAEPVPDEMFGGRELYELVAKLHKVMGQLKKHPPRGFEGASPAGLAAPQIGVSLRVFALALYPHAFVNPELDLVGKSTKGGPESCYSLHGLQAFIIRNDRVKLRYRLPNGEARALKMRDRDAVVAQHEYDHLNGVTIVQRGQVDDLEKVYAEARAGTIR